MAEQQLLENETIEDLQLNGLRLIQKKDAFRFGMDTVLLADFADIRNRDTVADLGTGNGALIFLLYGRGKGSRYIAIDILQEATELVRRNAVINGLARNRIITNFAPSCFLVELLLRFYLSSFLPSRKRKTSRTTNPNK